MLRGVIVLVNAILQPSPFSVCEILTDDLSCLNLAQTVILPYDSLQKVNSYAASEGFVSHATWKDL